MLRVANVTGSEKSPSGGETNTINCYTTCTFRGPNSKQRQSLRSIRDRATRSVMLSPCCSSLDTKRLRNNLI